MAACYTCNGKKTVPHPTITVKRRKLNGQIVEIPKMVPCPDCGGTGSKPKTVKTK